MRLGVFAKTFPGDAPGPVLDAVRAAGFAGTQYNMACSGLNAVPDVVPPATAAAVGRAAAGAGVAVEAVSATYNMIHPDPAVRRRGLRGLDAIAAAAGAMGTGLLTLCTGTRDPDDQWRYHPGNAAPDAWRDLLASFGDALRVAEAHDVTLGVEPEPANVVDSAARARRLIDELGSPRVRIVLDPANLSEAEPAGCQRTIVEEAVEVLGDRIALAHAKDRTADGRVAAPGRGAIDFPHFVSCLRRVGFDGPLVAHGFSADEAPSVARFLAGVVGEGGA
ncbi:epimerase [Gemmatimonadetes bacterium T265]|nr:epimerase [Gemmatimonadetes bacterium T265]